MIAEILTYVDYIAFSERLRKAGFCEDMSEEPFTCRWLHRALKLDVLAISKEVLGYANLWYEGTLRHATPVLLPSGASIRLNTAPYFLGTKMEAFRGGGQMNFHASHDLEDWVAVIDGRSTLLKRFLLSRATFVITSPKQQRTFLASLYLLMYFLAFFWTRGEYRSCSNA